MSQVEKVKSAADIVKIVGDYVKLRKDNGTIDVPVQRGRDLLDRTDCPLNDSILRVSLGCMLVFLFGNSEQ